MEMGATMLLCVFFLIFYFELSGEQRRKIEGNCLCYFKWNWNQIEINREREKKNMEYRWVGGKTARELDSCILRDPDVKCVRMLRQDRWLDGISRRLSNHLFSCWSFSAYWPHCRWARTAKSSSYSLYSAYSLIYEVESQLNWLLIRETLVNYQL